MAEELIARGVIYNLIKGLEEDELPTPFEFHPIF